MQSKIISNNINCNPTYFQCQIINNYLIVNTFLYEFYWIQNLYIY